MKRAPTQIVIINTLMRYARANFTDPAILEAEKAAKKVPKEKRAKTEKKKVSLRRVGSLLYVACCMLYVGLPVESGRLRRVGSLGQHCVVFCDRVSAMPLCADGRTTGRV